MNLSREPDAGEPRSLLPDEAEAVAMLFRNVAPKLLAPALLWTQGNRPQAEDLIQEVFLTAIRKWEEVGHLGFPRQKAWLTTALGYRAIDLWRASVRECPVPGMDFDQLRSPQDTAHHALCSMALDRTLKTLFAMPPTRYRAMCLYVLTSLETKEIAEILCVKEPTVRWHLKKARDILGKEIGPALPGAKDDPGHPDLLPEEWLT